MLVYKQHTPDCKGFTLVELLITIAIAGIVTAIAIPNFNQAIINNRLTTHTNNLVTAINIARSEAIKRGVPVVVQRTGAQWELGWIVFSDQDGSLAFNDDGDATSCEPTEDCLIRNYPSISPNFTLRSTVMNNITYTPTGLPSSGARTYRLCDNTANTTLSRRIILNTVGRTRVTTGLGGLACI